MKRRQSDGFTLVEIITVVLVLGVIAALAVPVFGSALESERARQCESNRLMIDSAATSFLVYGDLYTLPRNVSELVPAHLKSVPACPGGGTYNFGTDGEIDCSVHSAGP